VAGHLPKVHTPLHTGGAVHLNRRHHSHKLSIALTQRLLGAPIRDELVGIKGIEPDRPPTMWDQPLQHATQVMEPVFDPVLIGIPHLLSQQGTVQRPGSDQAVVQLDPLQYIGVHKGPHA
jgi:hypothetical protein